MEKTPNIRPERKARHPSPWIGEAIRFKSETEPFPAARPNKSYRRCRCTMIGSAAAPFRFRTGPTRKPATAGRARTRPPGTAHTPPLLSGGAATDSGGTRRAVHALLSARRRNGVTRCRPRQAAPRRRSSTATQGTMTPTVACTRARSRTRPASFSRQASVRTLS